jgi:hypothetical protein
MHRFHILQLNTLISDPQNPDSDFDSIFDEWELRYGLNPLDDSDALLDLDNDTLTNLREFELGTNPNNTDSNSDNYPDAWEVANHFDPTNPAVPFAELFAFHSPTIASISGIVITAVIVLFLKHKQDILNQKVNEEEEEQRALRELLS